MELINFFNDVTPIEIGVFCYFLFYLHHNFEGFMSSFDKAIPFLMRHEGGFVNHKDDPGGATNFGISLRFLEGAGYDIDGDGDVDIDDIIAMTKEHAEEIYRDEFWDKFKICRIANQSIATKMLDMSVNMGWSQAVKILQRAANRYLSSNILVVDGVIGQHTLGIINHNNDFNRVMDFICSSQMNFYDALIEKNPKLEVFKRGWLNRAAARP